MKAFPFAPKRVLGGSVLIFFTAFLTLLAVVVVMASGRQPVDTDVDRLKSEIK
jgi:hypothetical protein